MTGKNRRTLDQIETYLEPAEVYAKIQQGPGYPYKSYQAAYLLKRDRALASYLYLLALRISEGIRITKSMNTFKINRMYVKGIKLSKVRKKGHTRKIEFRTEGWIDLDGPRKEIAELILDYLNDPRTNEELFIKSSTTASKYISSLIGLPAHYLRAFGEDHLYSAWDHDVIAVANYVCVDPRTLQEYLRKGHKKYEKRKV